MKSVPDVAQIATRHQRRSLFTIIVGGLLLLLVFAVVIPRRACGCGWPESRAIGVLRAINSAQSTCSSSCGGDGYAQSLQDLVKPPAGSTAGFISSDFSRNGVMIDGYVFTVMSGPGARTVTAASQTCHGASADAVSHYFAEAHPLRVGKTGHQSFATDERGVIYVSNIGRTIAPDMAGTSVLQ